MYFFTHKHSVTAFLLNTKDFLDQPGFDSQVRFVTHQYQYNVDSALFLLRFMNSMGLLPQLERRRIHFIRNLKENFELRYMMLVVYYIYVKRNADYNALIVIIIIITDFTQGPKRQSGTKQH